VKVDVGPGEAALVLPKEVLEHICLTYTMLGDEESKYDNKIKWHGIAKDIEEWLQWNEMTDEKF
jgi:hypothetical protein